MADSDQLDSQENHKALVKEEIDLGCELITTEGYRNQESEWMPVKQEPFASAEEEKAEQIQEFEFVSVKEEIEDEKQLTFQVQDSKVTAANRKWLVQGYADNQIRESQGADMSSSCLDARRDCKIGCHHCGENIASVQPADVLQPLTCAMCSEVFMSKYSLIRHVFSHIDDVLPPAYICEICGDVFPRSTDLKHHALLCQASQYMTPNLITHAKPCQCTNFCIKFSNPENNQQHKCVHTKGKPCKCNICGKMFTQSLYTKVHNCIHRSEKPYECKICGKFFNRSRYLQIHRRSHTGEKPLQCDICGKKFSHSGDLKVHKRIHTGEKPYQCDICRKNFIRSCALLKHKRIHTGEKPYKCDFCGKTFCQSGSLKRHKKIHTGEKFNCKICGKTFFRSWCLEVHELTHTGGKPHEWEDFFTSWEPSNT